MSRSSLISRRFVLRGLAAGGLLPLGGCSLDSRSPGVMSFLDKAESLTEAAQRALLAPRLALAPEYPPGAITPLFQAERLDRSRRSGLRVGAPRTASPTGSSRSAASSKGR